MNVLTCATGSVDAPAMAAEPPPRDAVASQSRARGYQPRLWADAECFIGMEDSPPVVGRADERARQVLGSLSPTI
jgi:hypothetical protein